MSGIATSPWLQQVLNNGFRFVLGEFVVRSCSQCNALQAIQAIDIVPK